MLQRLISHWLEDGIATESVRQKKFKNLNNGESVNISKTEIEITFDFIFIITSEDASDYRVSWFHVFFFYLTSPNYC